VGGVPQFFFQNGLECDILAAVQTLSTGGFIHMKNLVMFLGAVLLVGAAACSSSSSGSSAGSCPAVGSKPCPNDPAVTQAEADSCNKCLSQGQAFDACANSNGVTVSTTPTCGSDGTSQSQTLTADQLQTLETKCADQLKAVTDCETPATTGDAGS
jgi:hypothetical protein